MRRNWQVALVLVLILSVFSQQQLLILDTSKQLSLNETHLINYSTSGNSTTGENEAGGNSSNENNLTNNDSALEYNLSNEISIDCHLIPAGHAEETYKTLGYCEIIDTSDYDYFFSVNITNIYPMFGFNNISDIYVVTDYSYVNGTKEVQFIHIYSTLFENVSFAIEFQFEFIFENENSTKINKTATLNVFEVDVDCESENLSNITFIYSEINCTFFRVDELRNETIFIDLQVNESFEEQNFTLNLSGMESKSIQLVAENSTDENLQNFSFYTIGYEVYMIQNNSIIYLSSYSFLQDMRYGFGFGNINPNWELNLSSVECEDVAVHMGVYAFLCLIPPSPSANDYDYNQTNTTDSERDKPYNDEPESLSGFLAINAIICISMASLIQLYKRKN